MIITIKLSRRILLLSAIVVLLLLISFFLGRWTMISPKILTYHQVKTENLVTPTNNVQAVDWNKLIPDIVAGLFGPLMAGLAIWQLGKRETDRKLKQDAIRDLMTFRGDYSSSEFTRSLNKVAIIFHDDEEIRLDIRKLYEVINNPTSPPNTTTRTIVGLIYKLCHKNGFRGLTEYDIDQSFVKASQNPEPSATGQLNQSEKTSSSANINRSKITRLKKTLPKIKK